MRSIRSIIVLLLLFQGADAFVPRPATPGIVAPWGVAERLKTDSPAEPSKQKKTRKPRIFQLVLPTHTRVAPATSLQAAASSGGPSSEGGPTRIIIAGAPASGKGTQCEKIKAKFGVVHLSTGDMLRAAVAAGTDIGKEAKAYMDSGKLVPDSTIIGVVKDRLNQEDCLTQGWLLDGFPRTQAQAQALEEAGITADCFLFLNVPDEVLVERVVGRRTDPVTGKIYHMTFSPPKDDDVIARLEHRSDDTEEKVKVRLEQFHANVNAVKDSYNDISVTIDGNQAPEIVSEMIFEAIDSLVAA